MGNRMLDCVLDENQPEACSSGLRLTTNNIMGHLAEIRSAGDRYRASHPNDIRELKQLIAETSPERERLRSQAGWQRPQSGFGTPLNALKKD